MIRATVNLRLPGGKKTFGDEIDMDSDTNLNEDVPSHEMRDDSESYSHCSEIGMPS